MSGGSYGWSDAFENEDDDFGDNPENSLQSKEYKSKDAVIFLIDASRSMWTPSSGASAASGSSGSSAAASSSSSAAASGDTKPESHARNVLQLAQNYLKGKVIATRKDQVAFCFYNTRVAENPNAFRGIHVLSSLDEPDANLIKKLEAMSDPATFEKKIGSCDQKDSKAQRTEFYQALWTCSAMFGERELKDCSKRVFLFTDSDSPDGDSKDLVAKAKQKGKDLEDLDISIELFPLVRPGVRFDVKKFFKELIVVDADEDTGKLDKFSEKFEDLENRFRKKEYKKRALATVGFELKKGMDISVKMYCLVREAKPDTGGWLDSKTNNHLTCLTKWLCEATGAHLEENQMKKYYPYGGEKVFFSKEEMTTIKTFGVPGLTLMGFKPMKSLKVFHNVKPAYFIYPTEERVRGSTVLFNALLGEMVSQNKYAMARLIYRKNGAPRFVACVPQKEEFDADGVQKQPPGMHMIFLPFADDIRSLKLPPTAIADTDLIDKAKAVVRALKIKFTPTDFENPSLQKHFACLQALALEEAAPQEVDDLVQPDEKGMDKFADLLDDFCKSAELTAGGGGGGDDSDGDGEGGGGGFKRKSEGKAKPGAAKKAKTAAASESIADIDWKNQIATGAINKLTLPVLKDYCRAKGLPVSGKKSDLIERVTKHALK